MVTLAPKHRALEAEVERLRHKAVRMQAAGVGVLVAVQRRRQEADRALDAAMDRCMFPEYFPPRLGEKRYTYLELLAALVPNAPSRVAVEEGWKAQR